MEFEQIIQRLDWLEKERGKDKEAITAFKNKLESLETSANALPKQIKELSTRISEITDSSARMDQFDAMLTKQRADLNKIITASEKASQKREQEAIKRHQAQLEEINRSVAEQKQLIIPIADIDKRFKERASEIQRLINNIEDLKAPIDNATQISQGVALSLKAVEEARKNDLKRVADIQGEIAAVRKRVEDSRDKSTLVADSLRNMDNRINEMTASEIERKQAQVAFIEQQTLAQLGRERSWKDWNEKVEEFKKEASGIGSHIQALDEALRGAKKAQETFLELNVKLERRINEITEMQRLTEDRLRQEWVSFKADDQKRWTGYNLSSEESFRDLRKDVQKYEQRITVLDDVTQVIQDQLHQTTDAAEQQLQELMNVVHEWLTSYERIMGHKKGKKG